MPQRDIYQDILKGLAIILVVYGHMARGMMDAGIGPAGMLRSIDFILYTTHMPVFFLVAGYNVVPSLQKRGSTVFLKSRWWALIYPYLLWSCILWGTKMLTAMVFPVNSPLTLQDLLNITWLPISPFWFLYSLLLMQLTLVALRTRQSLVLLPLSAALLGVAELTGTPLPYILKITILHLPFFALGAWLAQNRLPLIPQWLRNPMVILRLLLFFIGGSLVCLVSLPWVHPVGAVTMPITLSGIGLLMALTLALPQHSTAQKILAYAGRLSLPVYLMHILVTAQLRIIFTKVGLENPILMLTLGTLLGVALPLLAYEVAARLRLASWLGLTGKSPIN